MNGAQSAYLESRIAGASPGELIALLYQAAQDAVREARRRLENGDIPQRCQEISRAMEILMELRNSLDFANGGGLSVRLASLYDYMLQRLLDGNVRQDPAPLGEVAALLATLGEAWQWIAQQPAPAAEIPSVWHSEPVESTWAAGQAWSL